MTHHSHNHKHDQNHKDNHNHNHNHKHPASDSNKTSALNLAFWLNFIFSIIELVGGLLTNSTAIITDALHDFTDSMAIGMAVYLEKLSLKPATEQFTFGFKRFSLLSALAMSAFLLVGSAVMMVTAIGSFSSPKVVHSQGMLLLAVLGIVVNGLAFVKIKSSGGQDGAGHHHFGAHSHTHGHSHNHDSEQSNQNQNSKAIMLHLLEDLLGWVAVLVGAIIIYFTDWFWIDGVLTVLIALFIGYNAYQNIKETLKILLMATPNDIDIEALKSAIINLEEVASIDQLRVWSLDGTDSIASIQIRAVAINDSDKTLEKVQQVFTKFAIEDVTVQISS